MTFNSWEFLIFYPLVLLLYFLLPKKCKWPMLLAASYFFYICYNPSLVILIFGTTLVSWVSSNIIEKSEKPWVRKFAFVLTLTASLGVLFFYKYFDFLSLSVHSIVSSFSDTGEPFLLKLALPVGISFYTFQTLSYVIDVYRGDIKTEKNFFFYALFVSFFPQLVAGPIERPDNLMPQLREAHKWSRENAVEGGKRMLLGFFKKICVADLLGGYVDSVYNNAGEATALGIIIATLMFSVQIYCDFSGYTDIATGCARIMGIRLMKNFDRPYSATTIKEFWSRWHISLSSWFKDYLYIPLGGNRRKLPRRMFNLMLVFLVSGLWHGASWTFVIWGALHGFYQIVGNLTYKKRNRLLCRVGLSESSAAVIWTRRVITFALVAFSWLIFRANSISDMGILFGRLFSGAGGFADTFQSMGIDLTSALLIIFSVICLVMLDRILTYEDAPERSDIMVKNGAFIYIVWTVIAVWALLLSKDMVSTFIYFQF